MRRPLVTLPASAGSQSSNSTLTSREGGRIFFSCTDIADTATMRNSHFYSKTGDYKATAAVYTFWLPITLSSYPCLLRPKPESTDWDKYPFTKCAPSVGQP